MDSNAVADILLDLQQEVPGLHSLLIIRGGEVIVDASFYPYDGSTPHEMASVTKSVMTTLIGIAADRGFLRLDQPMVSFFPDREIANLDIVATTGGGTFESGDITDRLGAAVVDLNAPGGVPANPEGVARLDEVIAGLAQPPAAQPVTSLPATAATISGVTYAFPENPLEMATIRVAFSGGSEANLEIGLTDGRTIAGPVGLDGDFRFNTTYDYGFPLAWRGTWVDDDTFWFEWNEVANRDVYLLDLTFTEDFVTVEAREITHQAGVSIEGQAQGPLATPAATPS